MISTVATPERPNADTFMVTNANIPFAIVPYRGGLKDVPFYHRSLTSDETWRIEKAITRLPEFLMQREEIPNMRDVLDTQGYECRNFHNTRSERDLLFAVSVIDNVRYLGTGALWTLLSCKSL